MNNSIDKNAIRMALKNRRIEKGLTMKEVASKVGVSEGTISRWESGNIENMRRDKISKLADALDISPSEIMGWDDNWKDSPDHFRIPVLGHVAAGIPIEEIEDIVDWEEIPKDWLRGGKKYFALQLCGDSMEPRMYDGDVVIVQKQDDAESGEYVIAAVNGDHATCKRLMKYRDSIALLSLNSKYDPMIFTNEEVQSKPVTILGVVREIRGKMKGM